MVENNVDVENLCKQIAELSRQNRFLNVMGKVYGRTLNQDVFLGLPKQTSNLQNKCWGLWEPVSRNDRVIVIVPSSEVHITETQLATQSSV